VADALIEAILCMAYNTFSMQFASTRGTARLAMAQAGRQEGLCDCKGHASGDQDSLHPCAARMAQRRWETEAVARTGHGPAKPLDSPDMLVSIRAPALARGAGGGALPTAHITVRVSRREALPLGAADMIW
jgi:hypothetical protein